MWQVLNWSGEAYRPLTKRERQQIFSKRGTYRKLKCGDRRPKNYQYREPNELNIWLRGNTQLIGRRINKWNLMVAQYRVPIKD